MPRKLIALVLFVVLSLPLPLASSEDLESYLDCMTDKKVDIAFVFDTTNSMGGEISELRAVANKFATGLEASNIDFQLGLVEFRDFPDTCNGFSCGSPGDFAYQIKGNGTLTSDISTFSSWLKELKAGGGGSPGPEAVLTALRHAVTDMTWRPDAEKTIIVLTDAGPHPDGSCCNAEGDTLEGTVFTLTEQGTRVYVIGPDDVSLKQIATNTGGQFYEIRSGLSLKPLLEEITQSMSCSFSVVAETTCENKQLKATVQLVGKETIPYVKGQTEVWMYLDQSGSISRYNLSYDSTEEAYKAEVTDVCGSVEMTIYGRVGERSAVQTVHAECGTCGAAAEAESQESRSISGSVFDDSNGDGVKDVDETGMEDSEVLLEGPDGYSATVKTDRKGYYIFMGLLPGSYRLTAEVHENWTATVPAEGVQTVELVDTHESEINFGFSLPLAKQGSSVIELFNKTFGGQNDDGANSVQITPDGDYILAGYTYSYGAGGSDVWLLKVDTEGREIWSRTFGGQYNDAANSVQITPDGDYILAGFTSGGSDAWLLKVDSEGREIWNRTFGERQYLDDAANSVQITPDGSYILAVTTLYSIGNSDLVIKTDLEGQELWRKIFSPGIPTAAEIQSIQLTDDSDYVLAGWMNRDNVTSDNDAWLLKVDSEGDIIQLPSKTG